MGNVLYHFSDIVFVSLATFMAGCLLDILGRPHPLTGLAGASLSAETARGHHMNRLAENLCGVRTEK